MTDLDFFREREEDLAYRESLREEDHEKINQQNHRDNDSPSVRTGVGRMADKVKGSMINGKIVAAAYLMAQSAEPLEIAIKGLNDEEMRELKEYVRRGTFIKGDK